MERFGEYPRYEEIQDSGIEGDEDRFAIRVMIQDENRGQGRGRSKRAAERIAAEQALQWGETLDDNDHEACNKESSNEREEV